MARAVLSIALLLASLPLMGERVRVLVAVEPVPVSGRSVEVQRAGVIESLTTASVVDRWGRGQVFATEIDSSELELLRRDPRVRAISPDTGGRGALLESIPLIGGDVVAAQGFDGRDVTVAVIDSGIDVSNPDFAGRIVAQQCFCQNLDRTGCCPDQSIAQSGPGAAADDNGHGTHVTSIIAGGGMSGPRGLAPAAKIVAIKVLDAENGFASLTQIYRALEWILLNRPDVRVINMSLGTWAEFTSQTCAEWAAAYGFAEVLQPLRARGVVIAVSSGNDRSIDRMEYPACDAGVLAVGATYDAPSPNYRWVFRDIECSDAQASADQVACFSNSSDGLDLLAPGAPIRASKLGRGSTTMAGTSMAAPHVAGALALMLQASGGALTTDEAESILKATGVRITDPRNGLSVPRIDVAAAVAATPRPPSPNRRRAVRR